MRLPSKRGYNPAMANFKVDLKKKKSQALVVHCSDPRFQQAHREIIDSHGHYYDLLVFPGASKAIAENELVVDNIVMLHKLHGFKKICIFDHIECGAFGEIDDETAAHQQMINQAKTRLAKALPGIQIEGHLVGDQEALKIS